MTPYTLPSQIGSLSRRVIVCGRHSFTVLSGTGRWQKVNFDQPCSRSPLTSSSSIRSTSYLAEAVKKAREKFNPPNPVSLLNPVSPSNPVSPPNPEEFEDPETPEQRAVREIVRSVAARTLTTQEAVQRMTQLAKNKTVKCLKEICPTLWNCTFDELPKSKDSTAAIADFLIHLSHQSQEDFEDQLDHTEPIPIILNDVWGRKKRLWRDMPDMWPAIYDRYYEACTADSDYNLTYLLSLLFRSSQPAFDSLSFYLGEPFRLAVSWPEGQSQSESWETLIPAIVIQMETAGDKIKEKVLSNGPVAHDGLTLGRWRRWQKKLLRISRERPVWPEVKDAAKQAHDLMNIDRHLTNEWWRKWREELPKIVADGDQCVEDRIDAKRINEILADENKEEEEKKVAEAVSK